MINAVVDKIKCKCDWFDVFSEEGRSVPIKFSNNRLYSINEKKNGGTGVRLNIDGKTGFSYTNDPSKISDAVDAASALSAFGERENFVLPGRDEAVCSATARAEVPFSIDCEIEKGVEIIDRIRSVYPDAQVDMGISYREGKSRLVNSNGFDGEKSYSVYQASMSALRIFPDGSRVEPWYGHASKKTESISHLAEKILLYLKNSEREASLESGKYPVIMTPKAFSSLMDILLIGFSARAHYKKISRFTGKLGEKFFSDKLTVFDDPSVDWSPFSYPFDDEGVFSRKTSLIEKGIVSGFISDLKFAGLMGVTPSGNSSRSYSSIPHSSFSNIIVAPGAKSSAELIGGIKIGLMVDQFLGLGQSNTITGDFTANIDLGFMIENGEVTGRVKDCMVSDNIFGLLSGDIEISSDYELLSASKVPFMMCGSINFTK